MYDMKKNPIKPCIDFILTVIIKCTIYITVYMSFLSKDYVRFYCALISIGLMGPKGYKGDKGPFGTNGYPGDKGTKF